MTYEELKLRQSWTLDIQGILSIGIGDFGNKNNRIQLISKMAKFAFGKV
ncbi:MAG: hypothetical protein LBT50_11400 [Prevotellaceae bacterium]|jgi:hypothetical protein|nr:hypothetical protein [Prevotellaceae bacterium]